MNRGFGLEVETTYGDTSVTPSSFDPSFWNHAESVEFKLNDEPVTKSGSSRMNKRARAGIMKPTGSTSADADLQQLTWYFLGFLDNYKYTAGTGDYHTHEFYGGEGKELTSFRAMAAYDMLTKYVYGLLEDKLTLEVSDESMTVGADWIYKTEKATINGAFTEPDALTNEDLFIMFYDVSLKLNNLPVNGVSTAFSFEGNNNHNVDSTIGLGSRYPQMRAKAGKRENSISITTSLTSETVRSILDAEYGEVDALQPSSCKLLQIPLEVNINHCEDPNLSCKIVFPKCTVRTEYNVSSVDSIETTLTLESLGSSTVTLLDGTTEVETDMYIKLVNNQEALISE